LIEKQGKILKMSEPKCQLEMLATSASSELQYCADCGLVHLTMGPLTLRLSKKHFSEFARDMNKGLIQLKAKSFSSDSVVKDNVRTLHS